MIPGLTLQSGGGMRFAHTRGRIGNALQGINYPSPFFDLAHTYLPATVKALFRWCRYYFLTNPLINAVVCKLSEYPITDIIFDHESEEVKEFWTDYFQDHLSYRAFQVEVGLDFFTFGQSFISVSFPFIKYISCPSCHYTEQANRIKHLWTFTNYKFRLNCPSCNCVVDADAKDQPIRHAYGIRLVRWNPEDIEIDFNKITGQRTYYYTIPKTVDSDVVMGRKSVIVDVPQLFIQALKERKGIVFSPENIFHMRRPTLADDQAWGMPLLLPVLKDVFLLQLLKKSQEQIAVEHILPLRVIFPQPGSGAADPFSSLDLSSWRENVATEIARWRIDASYMPIVPLPIGNQTLGGDGKALLLFNEIQQHSDGIVAGMGVPVELIRGGTAWTGSNVSLRMLENFFLGYILRHRALARFVMRWVGIALEKPEANIRFKPFKMADDIQRKAYLFQLNQAGKISDTSLLADADFDQGEENAIMIRESDARLEATKKQQLAMAQMQAESQRIMMLSQAKSQQETMQAQMAPPAPGEPEAGEQAGSQGTPGGQPTSPGGGVPPEMANASQALPQESQSPLNAGQMGAPGVDLTQMASSQASLIAKMPPNQQEMALSTLRSQSPEFADLVEQILRTMQAPQNGASNGAKPLPEQRPPRGPNAPI